MTKNGPSKINKRPKRYFSQEDKQNLYIQWKASGLNRTRFCREHDLVASAFSKWCKQLHSNKKISTPENNWIPVVSKEISSEPQKEVTFINLNIPNITNVLLFALFCILFIRGLFDAIAIICGFTTSLLILDAPSMV
jgi:transposase-like protein